MCGLSGIMSSTLSVGEENTFRDLLNVSSLRGFEGSGVIVSQKELLKSNPNIVDFKTTSIAGALAYSEKMSELLKPRCNIIVGHARWPTKGGTDIAAVHPHRSEHIIGVHNGTMHRVAGEDVKDRSDSQLLFESFAKNGVIETIKKSEGAYALVWIDEKDQTLNFLRNSQRTLYFKNVGWQKNISTLAWASESEMLDFVYKRNYHGNNVWDTYLPVDTWYKYPLDVKNKIECIETVKDVKPEPKVYSYQGNFRGHGRGNTHYKSGVYNDGETDIYGYENFDDIPWMRADGRNVLSLPPPGMTLKEQARLARQVAREEKARLRRLDQFRQINGVGGVAASPQDISAQLKELAHESTGDRTVELEGKECCWCGSVACVGDTVWPVGHRAGAPREFFCVDCSRNPDCSVWIDHVKPATVVF